MESRIPIPSHFYRYSLNLLTSQFQSKKEKKRLKERAKLDKQLLEAKGEESTQARLRFATDITNLLFAIYFRILKSFTSNHLAGGKVSTKLLHPVLNGLAKFGHLMSIEYFQVKYLKYVSYIIFLKYLKCLFVPNFHIA